MGRPIFGTCRIVGTDRTERMLTTKVSNHYYWMYHSDINQNYEDRKITVLGENNERPWLNAMRHSNDVV